MFEREECLFLGEIAATYNFYHYRLVQYRREPSILGFLTTKIRCYGLDQMPSFCQSSLLGSSIWLFGNFIYGPDTLSISFIMGLIHSMKSLPLA